MDRLFLAFIGLVVVSGIVIVAVNSPEYAPNTTTTSTTSTTAEPAIQTTSSTSSTNAVEPLIQTTSTTSSSTTSTTAPRYVVLGWGHLTGCRESTLGNMNTLLANVSSALFPGTWGGSEPVFLYVCDGGGLTAFDRVMLRGGRSIGAGVDVGGEYRLMARCGRNQPVWDLGGCRSLTVYLDSASVEAEHASTTTTTLAFNPYLLRFTGLGYRKADLDIHWLCPSCVPAVNGLVMGEPGVKSRSLGYGQELNYVVYDPEIVSLERVLELAGAGGDVELINDTVI